MSLDERLTLAAQYATRAGFYWHGATLAKSRTAKRDLLVRGFQCWASAARQASLVETLAPNCAQEGFAEAAKAQDFVDGGGER